MRDDMKAQAPWIDAQMKAKGFSGISDESQKAQGERVKLAAQWRIFNRRDEQGNYLQNTDADAMNTVIYGDKTDGEKTQDGDWIAGTKNALGNAAAFTRGNARGRTPSDIKGVKGRGLSKEVLERARKDQGEADALAKWAEQNGMLIHVIPAEFSHDENKSAALLANVSISLAHDEQGKARFRQDFSYGLPPSEEGSQRVFTPNSFAFRVREAMQQSRHASPRQPTPRTLRAARCRGRKWRSRLPADLWGAWRKRRGGRVAAVKK